MPVSPHTITSHPGKDWSSPYLPTGTWQVLLASLLWDPVFHLAFQGWSCRCTTKPTKHLLGFLSSCLPNKSFTHHLPQTTAGFLSTLMGHNCTTVNHSLVISCQCRYGYCLIESIWVLVLMSLGPSPLTPTLCSILGLACAWSYCHEKRLWSDFPTPGMDAHSGPSKTLTNLRLPGYYSIPQEPCTLSMTSLLKVLNQYLARGAHIGR